MKIGFTGTRRGLTPRQRGALESLLLAVKMSLYSGCDGNKTAVGIHGCCVGADEEFHELCQRFGFGTIGRRSNLTNMRMHGKCDIEYEPEYPLDRNRKIVDECDMLIVCPRTADEELRSGTWATVRYAEKTGKAFRIIEPCGNMRTSIARIR